MKIPEKLKEVLTEAEIKDIKAEFDNQVNLAVETALRQEEESTIEKVKVLEQQINESHCRRLSELKDKWTAKYDAVKDYYENTVVAEANDFKYRLAKNIETLVESHVNRALSVAEVKAAAKNNVANLVLKSLRKQLGVDAALMKESIANPVRKMKEEMKRCQTYIETLKKENTQLNESLENANGGLILESKVSGLDSNAADHMRRMFTGKPVEYINENFDYALGLYRDGQAKRRESLRNDALRQRESKKNSVKEPNRFRDLISEDTTVRGRTKSADDKLIDEIVSEMAETI